jgi:hypothetical protein
MLTLKYPVNGHSREQRHRISEPTYILYSQGHSEGKVSKKYTIKVTLECREMLMLEDKFKSTDMAKFEVTSEDMIKTRTIYKALSNVEFLNGSFRRGFLGINLSLLRLEFLSGIYE